MHGSSNYFKYQNLVLLNAVDTNLKVEDYQIQEDKFHIKSHLSPKPLPIIQQLKAAHFQCWILIEINFWDLSANVVALKSVFGPRTMYAFYPSVPCMMLGASMFFHKTI